MGNNEPPLVLGGQGRSADSVRADAHALLLIGVAGLLALLAVLSW
jgi:hypothetical protein